MKASYLNSFVVTSSCFFIVLNRSHGFEVTQPQTQLVTSEGSASVRCKHTAAGEVQDVRLNILDAVQKQITVCQMDEAACSDVVFYKEHPNSYVFVLLNLGLHNMTFTYQCEVTTLEEGTFNTKKGSPTRLVTDQSTIPREAPPRPSGEETTLLPGRYEYCDALNNLNFLHWILIGLLCLMTLCVCVITACYLRFKRLKPDDEMHSTYVDMRKHGTSFSGY